MKDKHKKNNCKVCHTFISTAQIAEHEQICDLESKGFVFCEFCGQTVELSKLPGLVLFLVIEPYILYAEHECDEGVGGSSSSSLVSSQNEFNPARIQSSVSASEPVKNKNLVFLIHPLAKKIWTVHEHL
jgi:hypothetical protein